MTESPAIRPASRRIWLGASLAVLGLRYLESDGRAGFGSLTARGLISLLLLGFAVVLYSDLPAMFWRLLERRGVLTRYAEFVETLPARSAQVRQILFTRHGEVRKRAALGTGLLLSLVAHLWAITFLEPEFATNDDAAMHRIASGVYGSPSENLVFMNVSVGLLLKGLYSMAGDVPWYGLFLYTAQVIGLGLLVGTVIWWVRLNLLGGIALVSLLLGIGVPLMVDLQFTSASIVLASGGLLLTLALAVDGETPLRWFVITGLVVGFSYLIRANSLFAAGIAWLPLMLVTMWRLPRTRRPLVVAGGAAALVVAFGLVSTQLRYGDDQEWSEFNEFNASRSQLHGTPRLAADDELEEVLESIGWNWSDLNMFAGFFYTNDEVFSEPAVAALLESRGSVSNSQGLGGSFRLTRTNFDSEWLLLIGVVAALMLVSRFRDALLVGILPVWLLVVVVMLSYRLRLPSYVALPLFLSTGFAALVSTATSGLQPDDQRVGPRRQFWPLTALLAVWLAWGSVGSVLAAVQARDDQRVLDMDRSTNLATLIDVVPPEGVVMTWGRGLNDWSADPLAVGPRLPDEVGRVPLGWQIRSPDFQENLTRLAIPDVDRALVERDDIVLIAAERQAAIYSSYVADRFELVGSLWPVATYLDWEPVLYNGFATGTIVEDELSLVLSGSPLAFRLSEEPADGAAQILSINPRSIGVVSGWIGNGTDRPADRVLVFADGSLVAVTVDQLSFSESPESLGFYVNTPSAILTKDSDVRVFGIWGDEARELEL